MVRSSAFLRLQKPAIDYFNLFSWLDIHHSGMQTNVGPNNSNMYDLETKNGVIGVWGNAVLNTRMMNIQPGEEVKIVYGGLLKSEKSGRSYHSFNVFYRKKG